MRKVAIGLLAVTVLSIFVGCTAKKQNASITVENGAYSISPDEFVASFNAAVEEYRKTSDNQRSSDLLLLPDFEESAKEMSMGAGLSISYYTDGENGNLKELTLYWNDSVASNTEIMTAGFLVGALPSFFSPQSDTQLGDELDLNSDFFTGDVNIDDTNYEFTSLDGNHWLTIKPSEANDALK